MEEPLIRITVEDVAAANRLSLSCPICAGAVENNVAQQTLAPVICAGCQTLYHKACWEQHGDKCAVLGCAHEECYPHGPQVGPRLVVKYADLPKHVSRTARPNGRNKQLKQRERRLQRETAHRDFWGSLIESILRAFGWRR